MLTQFGNSGEKRRRRSGDFRYQTTRSARAARVFLPQLLLPLVFMRALALLDFATQPKAKANIARPTKKKERKLANARAPVYLETRAPSRFY